MICFIGFLIFIGLLILCKIFEDKDLEILSMISILLSIFILIVSIVLSINYFDGIIGYESEVMTLQQTRTVYADELNKYEHMRNEDCFSSPVYLELKEKIIELNGNIDIANRINNFLLDYSIINPAYREIKPIPLTVG